MSVKVRSDSNLTVSKYRVTLPLRARERDGAQFVASATDTHALMVLL
jgi:hypothetical protein